MTQAEKILEALKKAGDKGVTNFELNNICFRYGGRLYDLKRKGYKILTVHIKGTEWRTYLETDFPKKVEQDIIQHIEEHYEELAQKFGKQESLFDTKNLERGLW